MLLITPAFLQTFGCFTFFLFHQYFNVIKQNQKYKIQKQDPMSASETSETMLKLNEVKKNKN